MSYGRGMYRGPATVRRHPPVAAGHWTCGIVLWRGQEAISSAIPGKFFAETWRAQRSPATTGSSN